MSRNALSPALSLGHALSKADKRVTQALFITGVSGCGKTTIGHLLSLRLGCTFLEGDAFHSAASIEKMATGQSLDDEDRWPWLDRVGDAASLAVQQGEPVVISCSALRRPYRDRLARSVSGQAAFVQLVADYDTVSQRLLSREGHFMSPSLIDSQFATLEPPQPDEKMLMLDATMQADILCDDICAWLARKRV